MKSIVVVVRDHRRPSQARCAALFAAAVTLTCLTPADVLASGSRQGVVVSDDDQRVHAFDATAISIQDGDSLVVRASDGRRLRLRISAIDAPEKGQPFGEASRRHLATLAGTGSLHIEPLKVDPFGRTVANVYADGVDLGLAQLQAGLAWHFKRYQKDQTLAQRRAYADAEDHARARRLGLWQDRAPLEPWEFRARQRQAMHR